MPGIAPEVSRLMVNPDVPEELKSEESVKLLTNLAYYHPVFYCDDSLSMANDAHTDEASPVSRYEVQKALVIRMANIATMVAPTGYKGVDLHFINSGRSVRKNLSKEALLSNLSDITPKGDTKLGTVLGRDILEPLVYDQVKSESGLARPLLVCIITDGLPTDSRRKSLGNTIAICKEELAEKGYKPTSVTFCISQIGDDPEAAKFLDELDKDDTISDVLHCTTDRLDEKYKTLKDNHAKLDEWLLKMLSEGIKMKKSETM